MAKALGSRARKYLVFSITSAACMATVHCSGGAASTISDEEGAPTGVSPNSREAGDGGALRSNGDALPGASDAGGGGVQPASGCGPVGAPDGVSSVPLAFDFYNGSNGPAVQLNGGDPTGTWVVKSAKIYMPGALGLVFNRQASKGDAKGWAKISGNQVNMDLRVNTTTVVLGSSSTDATIRAGRGDGRISGNQLAIKWACPPADGDASETLSFGIRGDQATIMIKIESQAGNLYTVLEATKAN